MKKIKASEIKLTLMLDESPDLSWLGTFGNTAETPQAIKHNGGRGTFPWFNPGNAGEDYEDEYCQQDYKRMLEYERGDWYMMGVKAEITLKIPEFRENALQRFGRRLGLLKPIQKSWRLLKIDSAGLWGISSDSDDYVIEVWIEEIYDLRDLLNGFGVKIINDHPEFVIVHPPFDNESVVALDDVYKARLDNALDAGRIFGKFGRGIVRLLDSRCAKTQAEIAEFNAA